MSIASRISMMVEQMPVAEQKLVFELVRRICPDDVLTHDDIADIEEARAEYATGKTAPESAICW